MIYYIFVFASRNESTAFSNYLKTNGVLSNLINTPRECMTGCGISVKVRENDYRQAYYIFQNFKYKSTFKGVYSLEQNGLHNIVKRVR